jgi:hypothetical protein
VATVEASGGAKFEVYVPWEGRYLKVRAASSDVYFRGIGTWYGISKPEFVQRPPENAVKLDPNAEGFSLKFPGEFKWRYEVTGETPERAFQASDARKAGEVEVVESDGSTVKGTLYRVKIDGQDRYVVTLGDTLAIVGGYYGLEPLDGGHVKVTLREPFSGAEAVCECTLKELGDVKCEGLLEALNGALGTRARKLVYLLPVPVGSTSGSALVPVPSGNGVEVVPLKEFQVLSNVLRDGWWEYSVVRRGNRTLVVARHGSLCVPVAEVNDRGERRWVVTYCEGVDGVLVLGLSGENPADVVVLRGGKVEVPKECYRVGDGKFVLKFEDGSTMTLTLKESEPPSLSPGGEVPGGAEKLRLVGVKAIGRLTVGSVGKKRPSRSPKRSPKGVPVIPVPPVPRRRDD